MVLTVHACSYLQRFLVLKMRVFVVALFFENKSDSVVLRLGSSAGDSSAAIRTERMFKDSKNTR